MLESIEVTEVPVACKKASALLNPLKLAVSSVRDFQTSTSSRDKISVNSAGSCESISDVALNGLQKRTRFRLATQSMQMLHFAASLATSAKTCPCPTQIFPGRSSSRSIKTGPTVGINWSDGRSSHISSRTASPCDRRVQDRSCK